MSSPYINHFIQPDSIIPNPTDPQSLNRFSYVKNNPLRYADPTGHSPIDGPCGYQGQDCGSPLPPPPTSPPSIPSSGGGNGGGSGNDNEKGGDPIEIDPWEKYTYGFCWDFNSLVGCTKDGVKLNMGDEPIDVDPAEFEEMIMFLIADAHNRTKWELVSNAFRVDTPFYDESIYGFGKLSGTGCINGECYARHELNYVAQGVLWARVGVSKDFGHEIVKEWKALPIGHLPGYPSEGTYYWFDYGYDAYMEYYSP